MKHKFIMHKNSSAPLYLQVYHFIRQKIVQSTYAAGEKLPSSRQLAKELNVARDTVKEAYALLLSEGFIVSNTGAGTFVNPELEGLEPKTLIDNKLDQALPLANWVKRLGDSNFDRGEADKRPFIDFGFGRSYPHVFPYHIWRQLLSRYLSTDDMMLSRYGSVAGFLPLRIAIADYISQYRGVTCNARQIVVLNGAQQAFDLLARLFVDNNDAVFIESPGYPDAFEIFQAHGAKVVPIPVDAQGLPVDTLPQNINPKLLFITPSNQFPRGGALSANRRLKLLNWVSSKDTYIIEDDYDGALRYEGRPRSSLQGLDSIGRVIYLGTFSKVLFPALRLAYIVLPEQLIEPFLQAKRVIDRGSPTLTQAAVSDFMSEGHFMRHLRQLRNHYGGIRKSLVTAVTHHLGDQVTFSQEPAGLHLMLYLKGDVNEQQIVAQLLKDGVHVTPGAQFHFTQPVPPSLLLGFSKLEQGEIEQGIHLLKKQLI